MGEWITGIIRVYIGTTMGDPFPHSLLSTREMMYDNMQKVCNVGGMWGTCGGFVTLIQFLWNF